MHSGIIKSVFYAKKNFPLNRKLSLEVYASNSYNTKKKIEKTKFFSNQTIKFKKERVQLKLNEL
jgi:hypothetical protein